MDQFVTSDLLQYFCLAFQVDVVNVHSDSEGQGIIYYDFVDVSGAHVLTLAGSELAEFIDRAEGHMPPYGKNTPTHKHYAEFTERYFDVNHEARYR